MLCVYALASAPATRMALKGMSGERLRTLAVGRVAAIVGELRRPPRATEQALREYGRIQQALAARLPATIPARFATCFADGDELTLMLRSRQATFRKRLQAVRGRVQMTVRVIGSASRDQGSAVEPTSSGPHGAGNKARPPGLTGTEYLKARAAARDVPEFAPARATVRRWVRDERVEKRGRLASVYHLVPRGSAPAYRRAMEAAAAAAGHRGVVSGPWPPYAFSTPF